MDVPRTNQAWCQLAADGKGGVEPEVATQNTHLAAALVSLGVGFWVQKTWIEKTDRVLGTWHLQPASAVWKGLKTGEVALQWHRRELHPLCAGFDGTPWAILLLAGMYALEARSVLAEGKPVHQVHVGRGLCQLFPASARTADFDLGKIAAVAGGLALPPKGGTTSPERTGGAAMAVQWRKAALVALVCGFPLLAQAPDGGVVLGTASLVNPELRLKAVIDCVTAVRDYAAAARSGRAVTPPAVELPGAAPGYHPAQFAAQALFNLEDLHAILRNTPETAFLQHEKHRLRSSLVRSDAPDDELSLAVRHTGRNLP